MKHTSSVPGDEARLTEQLRGWTAAQRLQLEVVARLRRGEVDALLELYDQMAPTLFGYALAVTRNRRHAIRALRQAFLDVWQAPVLLSDPRVPPLVAVAALLSQTANRQPIPTRRTRPAAPAHHAIPVAR